MGLLCGGGGDTLAPPAIRTRESNAVSRHNTAGTATGESEYQLFITEDNYESERNGSEM